MQVPARLTVHFQIASAAAADEIKLSRALGAGPLMAEFNGYHVLVDILGIADAPERSRPVWWCR